MYISMIFFLITILLSVAFFTLLERKILGYIHLRVGPNKNLLLGLGQPFNDLIKLFSKMEYKFSKTMMFLFFISPSVMVIFAMTMWSIYSHTGNINSMKYFFLMVMVLNGLLTFFFLFTGWSSGSFYSMIGAYRSSAQCISYEAIFFFCIIIMVSIFFSFNTFFLTNMSFFCQNLMVLLLILIPWMLSLLAECNRTPFDFAEGESELVSGFNTEYGSGLFSIIFLSEYMSMLFYSFFSSWVFLGKSNFFMFFFFFFLLIFVWVRTSFPRLRYDKLMVLSWKSLMFLITGLFFIYFLFFFF